MAISTHGDGQAQDVTLRQILSEPSIRVVLLIVFVIMLGFGIIVPILPLYARSFGVSYDVASLLISAFAFARLIFDPVAGPIVGRYGERLSAMTGVTAVGISALLTGFAPNFALAVVFRAAGGFGSSLLFAALYSYVLKVVPSQRMGRTMSAFYGTLNVGLIAGGPIGGVVAHAWGLASPLFVYSGLCFLSGVLYMRFMPDPGSWHKAAGEARPPDMGGWRSVWAQSRDLLRIPEFVTVLVLNMAFFWMAAGGYDTLVPLFGKEGLGMSPVGIGGVFAIAVAAEFVVLYPAGSASDRIGRRPVLIPALAGLAVMNALVGWAASPLALGVLMGLLGLCSGSTAAGPSAMLADVTPPGMSPSAVGLFRLFGDLGFVLGPLVGGVAAGAFGFRWAFGLLSLPVLLALALVIRTPETLRSRRPSVERWPAGAAALDEEAGRP